MTDSALAIAVPLIAGFEGFEPQPYQDQVGVWTIGYGFTYLPDMSAVTATTPAMTQEAAQAQLEIFVAKTLSAVRDMAHVPITDDQAAALTSFAYNEGTSALRTSTLMDRLNAREPATEVAQCFASWVYAGGHIDNGLVSRRAKEAALFLRGEASTAPSTAPTEMSADELDAFYNHPTGTV